jgi:acyl-CoA synthetase (AMP-forming)/AMP-acid ligase II
MPLNYGDILDAVAPLRMSQTAISSHEGDLSWEAFDRRTNALARNLIDRGLLPGDKVCFLLFNGASYLELLAACFKARFVHVNANFRYLPHELEHILEDSDAKLLVYDERLAETVANISVRCSASIIRVQVGAAVVPNGVIAYEDLVRGPSGPLDIERSPDDLIFIYTGGTTGQPKAVMWPHRQQVVGLLGGAMNDGRFPQTVAELVAQLDAPKPYLRPLIASPLMHASGLYAAITTLCNGGQVIVTDNGGPFDAVRHWALIDKYRADAISLVGDTFAKPMLAALEAGGVDGSSVRLIGSSGVMWSRETKLAMLKHLPQATLYDALGSSEAMGLGSSIMTAASETTTATFKIGPSTKVFTEDGREVTPGSGEAGYLARSGPMPLGYYKDEAKTAAAFRTIAGERYIVPGDLCTVDADGTIHLLGRGSNCINSGGEKIFPEEVEEALKRHPDIADALVFGLPDPQWGSAVQAVVRLEAEQSIDPEELREYLKGVVARYKVPKKIAVSREGLRLANGKPDYDKAKLAFAAYWA